MPHGDAKYRHRRRDSQRSLGVVASPLPLISSQVYNAETMDYKFWLPLVVTLYGVYLNRKQVLLMIPSGAQAQDSITTVTRLKRHWPLITMALLVILVWSPYIYGRYHPPQEARDIGEFDSPDTRIVEAYGQDSPNSCYLTVNGAALLSRQSGYKLAVACYVSDGRQDILDVPYLQVSNLYDIRLGEIVLRSIYKDYFQEYRKEMNSPGGIGVALLNVPNGVELSQFSTLRQARSLGVKIPSVSVAMSAGPPIAK